jgi:opacity protein-like surface antigen
MRSLAFASAFAFVVSVTGAAAVPVVYNWTGFYIGGYGGYGWDAEGSREPARPCNRYGSGLYYIPGTNICAGIGMPASSEYWFLPPGTNAQVAGFVGGTNVRSFGSEYDTGIIGGRAAIGFTLPAYWRAQVNVDTETTGHYCPTCGRATYLSVGGHLNWNVVSNFEIGALGGALRIDPTFAAPTSYYNYIGGEGRYFTDSWLVGAQAGYLDLNSGPGTGSLTDAFFAEGRLKFNFGNMFNSQTLRDFSFAATLGYATGRLATTPVKAESTQWSGTIDYRINPLATVFVSYKGYENKTAVSGIVWEEHSVLGGLKIDLGTPNASVPIETMLPLPVVFSVMHKF